ncbi:MAG: hypothetical protein L7F77_02960 [Candidatus Magnetominusculus sp. LBB02]|nr:hypothetical protein [Candidatus Magnetominusculus sp. LBB02]
MSRCFEAALENCEVIRKNLNRAFELLNSFKKVSVDQSHQERRRFF